MKNIMTALVMFSIMFSAFVPAQTVKIDSVTIATGDSISSVVNLEGYSISGIIVSDSLAGTAITFLDSRDNSVFNNVLGTDGTEIEITLPLSSAIPNRKIIALPTDVYGLDSYVKLRTGTVATPTNQTSDQVVYIELTKMIGE